MDKDQKTLVAAALRVAASSMEEPEPAEAPQPEPPKENTPPGFIFGVLAGALLGAGLIGIPAIIIVAAIALL